MYPTSISRLQLSSHAVVIGGSIAGLLAARVLAEHFERVTVIERDYYPENPEPRSGVAQSNQAHFLLARGKQILEELFPSAGVAEIKQQLERSKFRRPTEFCHRSNGRAYISS